MISGSSSNGFLKTGKNPGARQKLFSLILALSKPLVLAPLTLVDLWTLRWDPPRIRLPFFERICPQIPKVLNENFPCTPGSQTVLANSKGIKECAWPTSLNKQTLGHPCRVTPLIRCLAPLA